MPRAHARRVLLERREGKRVALWVAEQRGRFVWLRTGFAGGKGRIRSIELPDETAAAEWLEREVAARIEEGFGVVDEHATVSGPFRSSAQRARPRRLSPGEIRAAIEKRFPPLPAPLDDVVDAFCELAPAPATMRLASLELDGKEGEPAVWLSVAYARGAGDNVDDYELEGFAFWLRLAEPWPAPSDGVSIDVFADGLRHLSAPALVNRFERGVRDLPMWAVIGARPVIEIDASHS